MNDIRNMQKRPNNLILENREKLSISGVMDVDSFDEESVIMLTDGGGLTVRGQGLRIDEFSVDAGELLIRGTVHAIIYSDDIPQKGGIISRLFK